MGMFKNVIDLFALMYMTSQCDAATYSARCYCPGTDSQTSNSKFKELQDLMYQKRREYTRGLNMPAIHYFPGNCS